MNRSFRDYKMPATLHQRPGMMKLGAVIKEKEEDLELFLEMRKREKERHDLLLHNPDDHLDSPLGSKPDTSPLFKIATSATVRKVSGPDDFLNSEGDKTDYDWLLTPPGTPLFPSLEKEAHGSSVGQIGTPKTRPAALKSRLSAPQIETTSRNNLVTRQPISSAGLGGVSASLRRPSSSASSTSSISRPSTPTGRSSLPSATKSISSTKSTLPATTRSSRPSTPTSRSTLTSTKPSSYSKPASSARSSTPVRSSTPTARSSLPSKTSSRPSTPTRRPTTPSLVSNNSGPPARSSSDSKTNGSVMNNRGPPGRSSSVSKTNGTMTNSSGPPGRSSSVSRASSSSKNNPAAPRAASPTVRTRAWQASEMPGFSLDAPPNLRTTMPERPVSASRGRPGAPSALRSGAPEANGNVRPRRQSCSPTGLRGRAPQSNGTSGTISSRSHTTADEVNPVVIGNKMVERVINARRLAPPRQDDNRSSLSNSAGKSTSSPDSGGFGRTLSKKSLDMALRHMDIRRSIPGGLRPLMTNVPASSMYSVRSGPSRSSRPVSISDSPHATSSNASSEQSVNNNNLYMDQGSELDDDLSSEKGSRFSPAVQVEKSHVRAINGNVHWLHSPDDIHKRI